ncbi:MAG TPA: hypothetical protein VHQ65_13505, partial [Thermoanaerobaculia bacterium]|nr:hypothetical protein [Thermoanaerobaculia bacterium]
PPPPPGGPTAGGPPPPGGGVESPNRGLMIVLSYLWLLALIPLLAEKEDREVQWHAKHGLVLTAAEIIIAIGLTIVSAVLDSMGGLGCATCGITSIFWLVVLVVHVICIIQGINGKRFIIPGLSPLADRF